MNAASASTTTSRRACGAGWPGRRSPARTSAWPYPGACSTRSAQRPIPSRGGSKPCSRDACAAQPLTPTRLRPCGSGKKYKKCHGCA
ncbi:MAG: SEC-C domain-containing protein [Deltaproteobacteria bacterium]|nr:SEC-C domain-containing protein [Deltaproteobacteria bacterium]